MPGSGRKRNTDSSMHRLPNILFHTVYKSFCDSFSFAANLDRFPYSQIVANQRHDRPSQKNVFDTWRLRVGSIEHTDFDGTISGCSARLEPETIE